MMTIFRTISPLAAFALVVLTFWVPVVVNGDDTHTVCMCNHATRNLLTEGTRFLAMAPTDVCACSTQGNQEITFAACCNPPPPTAPAKRETGFIAFILSIIDAILAFFRSIGINATVTTTRRSLESQEHQPEAISILEAQPFTEQVCPDVQPDLGDKEGILLAENIGLWMFPDFLNDDEVDALIDAAASADVHSYDCKVDFCERRAHNKRCIDNPDYQSKIQPEGKACLSLVDGALSLLDSEAEDSWRMLHKKTLDLWPQYPSKNPLVYQRTDATTDKFKYHVDGMEHNYEYGMISPVTVVVYLSDGGSQLIFPHANHTGVFITPKKGMAITWHNMDVDYKPLMAAVHGVQATGDLVEPRLAIQNEFTLDNSFFGMEMFEAKNM